MQELLAYKPDFIHIKDKDGATPLIFAANKGHKKVITCSLVPRLPQAFITCSMKSGILTINAWEIRLGDTPGNEANHMHMTPGVSYYCLPHHSDL